MDKTIPNRFPIEVFNMEKYNDVLSKARLRIFYKGGNRNGSYISDEFAEKLIKTLPYTPVKGIYEEDKEDYTDHGDSRNRGKIYGIVPDNPNFAWEKNLDKDGIEREYATTDVLIFSALYEEANDIVGKAQSMELYVPSIKGEWVNIGGDYVFKYSDASFIGLQVLGEGIEPCFQGAAFFNLDSIQSQQFYILLTNIYERLDQLTVGRTTEMDKENLYNPIFALSDNQKQDKLFQAVNVEKVRYWILDTYDTYAIAYDMEEDGYVKFGYTKDDNAETVTLVGEMEPVFAEFVTKEEKEALKTLRGRTEEGTYASVNAAFDKNVNDISEMQSTLNDKDNEISTLNTDKETFEKTIGELNDKIQEFQNYKNGIETAEKEAVITRYAEKLEGELLATYSNRLEEFTVDSLEKELAYVLVKNDASIFAQKDTSGYVPKPDQQISGLEALLTRYKK